MNAATKGILRATLKVYKDEPEVLESVKQFHKDLSSSPWIKARNTSDQNHFIAYSIFLKIANKLAKMENVTNIDHTQRAHALLSASGASRWLNCTPSPRLEEGFENKDSFFSSEGTLAHEFAEINLKKQLKLLSPKDYALAAAPFLAHECYSSEMETEVQKHVDYVVQQYTEAKRLTKDAVLLIEEKVDFSHLVEKGFGTCDDVIIADGVLEVIDLKYGKGLKVDAEENAQLKLYGLGALRTYELAFDIHTVRLTIVQPRLDAISSWETSVEDLTRWGDEVVKPKAVQAYAGEGEQVTGAHCQFCKAKAKCRALADESLAVAKHEFKNPALLADDELLEVYAKIGLFSAWFTSVSDHIFQSAIEGKTWEGYKLVEGRSVRVWKNEDEIKDVLSLHYDNEQFVNTKLKGIGDIEKLVGKANFNNLLEGLVIKPAGKPTLVPNSDKRNALAGAKEDFS